MKVKIYKKNNKDKVTTLIVQDRDDLKRLVTIAKSVIFLANNLKDIDYNDGGKLVFKIDGEKYNAGDIIKLGEEQLKNVGGDNLKKKKKKNGKKKKNHKNDDSEKKKKKSKKKKEKFEYEDDENGYIRIHRREDVNYKNKKR